MHFIWAGGSRPMPVKNIMTALEWKQKHPEFQIYLWIDEQTEGPLSEIKKRYEANFQLPKKHLDSLLVSKTFSLKISRENMSHLSMYDMKLIDYVQTMALQVIYYGMEY